MRILPVVFFRKERRKAYASGSFQSAILLPNLRSRFMELGKFHFSLFPSRLDLICASEVQSFVALVGS